MNMLLNICDSFAYNGLDGELNPGPLAPKARIIPLDHRAWCLNGESNPGQLLGRQLCYHYTIEA